MGCGEGFHLDPYREDLNGGQKISKITANNGRVVRPSLTLDASIKHSLPNKRKDLVTWVTYDHLAKVKHQRKLLAELKL